MKLLIKYIVLIITIISAACSSSVSEIAFDLEKDKYFPLPYYEIPIELKDPSLFSKTITTFSNHLQGKKFFIDPGHGGGDRTNSNIPGNVREADVNLSVALCLRDFLIKAGAAVILSRETDTSISLEERTKLANESSSDLFISIHHNAPGDSGKYWVNYTSTFYHSVQGEINYNPYEHNIAKYVQRDLSYAMRNSGGLGSFDGTYSDYWIYPGKGFHVLRETDLPAILVECSFYTSRFEKVRLNISKFNEIQAWGIFNGIAKFFENDFPQMHFDETASELNANDLHLYFSFASRIPIDPNSIRVIVDSSFTDFNFNTDNSKLAVELKDISIGEHNLTIFFSDKEDLYGIPFRRRIFVQ